jgi:hypothetical protein
LYGCYKVGGKLIEVETCRIEFSRDRSLYDFGDNYGAWLALSRYLGTDQIIEQIEVFPTSHAHFTRNQDDSDFYTAGNTMLVSLLMRSGWEISLRDNGGRVTNMQRMA